MNSLNLLSQSFHRAASTTKRSKKEMSKFIVTRLFGAAALALALAAPVAAQETTDICLKTGETIKASSVELQGAQYLVVPLGVHSALKIPADRVKSIGAACHEADNVQAAPAPSAPTPSAQPVVSPPQAAPNQASNSTRFGVHGSSALGERLLPALIETYAQKRGWKVSVRDVGTNRKEIALSSPGASQPAAIIDLLSGQSADAAKGLLDGTAAIGMSARRLDDAEATQFRARFGIDPLTAASGAEHVVALDALAVIVHRDNPIKTLTFDQIARLFTGEVANWRDVRGRDDFDDETGGADGPVHVHALDASSEGGDFFVRTLMGANRAIAASAQIHGSNEAQSKAVGKDPGAIGFVRFPYLYQNKPLDLATPCGLIAGPSRFTVKTEQYQLARRLYLYTAGEPKEQQAREFLQFALSDEAQEVVVRIGLVDQSIEYQDSDEQRGWLAALGRSKTIGVKSKSGSSNADAKSKSAGLEKEIELAYETFKSDAESSDRTTAVFRFERNSSNLDAKARQDVVRLFQFIRKQYHGIPEGYIAGFADWDGGLKYNSKLSLQRAQTVAQSLRQLGLVIDMTPPKGDLLQSFIKNKDLTGLLAHMNQMKRISLKGYSSLAPVACNDDEAGKTQNRRVEFWGSNPRKYE